MEFDIRTVAIYVRKSRDDKAEEDVLKKHRDELTQFAEKHGWAYTLYEEVGSGEKIDVRPKMTELLQDVELKMFDGVMAIHFDRLSRGDESDQAKIKKAFQRSETLFITTGRIYDWNNEQDIMMSEFEGLVSRMEYRQISRRFRQGKARNAKAGFWSNGKPPYPYFYNPETKKADFNEKSQEYFTYRYMVELSLKAYPCTDIAWELNKQGIKSPRGTMWQPAVVRRILCDEVHLGHMVVGKKRKVPSGDIVRKPKTEWITYYNCHKPCKTEREHQQILFLIQQQRETPKKSRAGSHSLSGLIRCMRCRSTMQIQKRKNRPNDYLKSCSHTDHFGTRCGNIGGNTTIIEKAIRLKIEKQKNALEKAIEEGIQKKDLRFLLKKKEYKLRQIKEKEKSISKVFEGYEAGLYSIEQSKERKTILESDLSRLEEEYNSLGRQLNNLDQTKNEDMLDEIKEVLERLDQVKDHKELNRIYKRIIYSVEWERSDITEEGAVKVNFLSDSNMSNGELPSSISGIVH